MAAKMAAKIGATEYSQISMAIQIAYRRADPLLMFWMVAAKC